MAYVFADQVINLDEEITLKVQELCASGLPPVDSYTRSQIDAKLADKADADDVYDKTAVDDLIDGIEQVPEFTSSDANKVLAVNAAGTEVEWATAGGGGGGSLPEAPSIFFNYQLVNSGGDTSWDLMNTVTFSYDATLDTAPDKADWATDYTLTSIPAFSTVPFAVAVDCGESGTAWSTIDVPYNQNDGTNNYTAKAMIWQTAGAITEGAQSYANALNFVSHSLTNSSTTLYSGQQLLVTYNIVWLLDSNNKVFRVITGTITNLTDSNVTPTFRPSVFSLPISANYYIDYPE